MKGSGPVETVCLWRNINQWISEEKNFSHNRS